MGILIRREREDDYSAVENLTRRAFWNVYRPGCTEHYVLHCFRKSVNFVPELDLVMEKDGIIIGQIMYARAQISADSGKKTEVLTFGPVSVAPEYRGCGYGGRLVEYSLEQAQGLGAGAVLITGDLNFYGKFGFFEAGRAGIRYADADGDAPYFLAKELKPGFLDSVGGGSYRDPEEYFAAQKNPPEFDAFDALFPPMKKQKLPGQLE